MVNTTLVCVSVLELARMAVAIASVLATEAAMVEGLATVVACGRVVAKKDAVGAGPDVSRHLRLFGGCWFSVESV